MSGDGLLKILVADDDRVSLRLMERMLKHHGYDVCTADDGLQAASMLCAEGAPRLALIDWMMPGLDGPSVCREVRKRQDGSYVYIMLLTSKQLSEDVVNGLQAGADDYLTKPCNPAELEARLRFWSANPEARRQSDKSAGGYAPESHTRRIDYLMEPERHSCLAEERN